MDRKTLHRLKQIASKAVVDEHGSDHPCDRMIRDLRQKCAEGDLQFMIVSAPPDTADRSIGPYTVCTTLVTPDACDIEDTQVVGMECMLTILLQMLTSLYLLSSVQGEEHASLIRAKRDANNLQPHQK